jgi:hypothetical protein
MISKLNENQEIEYYFKANLKSTLPISEISYPDNCEIIENNRNDVIIQKIGNDFKSLKKDMHIYYRSENMDEPRFIY